jgi:hypothetical protein
MEPLFVETSLKFEKTGSEVTLPEDPNAWPNEILQELFKQVPYIADFEPHVVMDRVDAERAYGFGHVEVMNKTEIQRGVSPEGMDAAGVRQARIPVIIKDRKLQPFDVVITEDSQMLPLTEPRLRQAIFRPQAFDITARTPGDMSMIGQLYPPYRQNYGFGGGGATMSVGMGKSGGVISWQEIAPYLTTEFIHARMTKLGSRDVGNPIAGERVSDPGLERASTDVVSNLKGEPNPTHGESVKQASMLSLILPTINESDYNGFFDQLRSQSIQSALIKNGAATSKSLALLAAHTPMSTEKTGAAVLGNWPMDVMQIRREDDGYHIKTASSKCWAPRETLMDRGELVRFAGEKIALDVDNAGSTTAMEGDPNGPQKQMPAAAAVGEVADPEEDRYEMIKDFGIYKVKDSEGRELIGYVFPNLIDTDGRPLPIFLFTNGSQSAVQGEIVGINVGGGASIPEGSPRGKGVFYEMLSNGRAQATIPMTINATMAANPEEGGETTLHAETWDGRPVEVRIQENISRITPMDGTMLIPAGMNWLPLDNSEEVELVGEAETADAQGKVASRQPWLEVRIRAGGVDSFSFEGMPVEKLARMDRSFLSLDESLFLLAGLGIEPEVAGEKLASAMVWSAPVSVIAKRGLSLPDDLVKSAYASAGARMSNVPNLRINLLKEAAVIPDPTAVDTVLSLGFINPENVGTFISYLPTLDEGQKKMCELLVASRLGLRDVPPSALEKAIRSVEEVIEGLKVMAFQKN